MYKSCATLTKQQVMAADESADIKIYGRVCLACTCRASHTGRFPVGLNQMPLFIIRVMQETGICGICDNDRKTNQGRSTTTVSAGVVRCYKKVSSYQPAEVEEKTSLIRFSIINIKPQISSVYLYPDNFKACRFKATNPNLKPQLPKFPFRHGQVHIKPGVFAGDDLDAVFAWFQGEGYRIGC